MRRISEILEWMMNNAKQNGGHVDVSYETLFWLRNLAEKIESNCEFPLTVRYSTATNEPSMCIITRGEE